MMWMVIQDPADPLCQISGFGRRDVFEAGGPPDLIWTSLPSDFGTEGYGERRKRPIARHFKRHLVSDTDELLWVFDLWGEPSAHLRQYLWAHGGDDVARARRLIEVLPAETVLKILRYLVDWYWERYLGWPDLLAF